MNSYSKIFTLILCVTLLLALLVGCNTSKPTTGTDGQNVEANTDADLEGSIDGDTNQEGAEQPEPVVEEPNFVSPYHFEYPDAVRGIFVTSHSAGGARMERLVELVNTTELNAMVIDIKDDHGYITFPLEDDHPFKHNSRRNIKDVHEMMKLLEENKIYPIARIVVFKDSVMANEKPEWSFLENGQVWKNRRGESFINPYLKEVWEYNVEIAKMAAELGFKEIQFDYVRFPEGFEKRDETLQYSRGHYQDLKPTRFYELEESYATVTATYEKDMSSLVASRDNKQAEVTKAKEQQAPSETVKALEKELSDINKQIQDLEKKKPKEPDFSSKERYVQLRVDAVTDFVAYASEELKHYGVDVSVDIFGYTATLPEAPGIGQNFSRISENVDVICSMIYPSHWGFNYFGIPKPDLEPYRLVKEYIIRENEKLAELQNPPTSRPWIQDFTASYLGAGNYKVYGKKEVEDQIRALNEHGVWEFLLWNAGNNYSPGVNYLPIGRP